MASKYPAAGKLRLQVVCTEEEAKTLKEAAQADERDLSSYLRRAGLAAAATIGSRRRNK